MSIADLAEAIRVGLSKMEQACEYKIDRAKYYNEDVNSLPYFNEVLRDVTVLTEINNELQLEIGQQEEDNDGEDTTGLW